MDSGPKIGLLLHFYQPWWQSAAVLDRIVNECYRPIFRWADARQGFSFSANINWSLLELLWHHGHDEVVELMERSVRNGKVELFGTAAYHPIMPLRVDTENLRQIQWDRERKAQMDFPIGNCGGFYLPEYAFSREALRPIRETGYSFTVADDACYGAQHGNVPFDRIPKVDGTYVFLRSRRWGNALSQGAYDFDRLNREMVPDLRRWFDGRAGYLILATDAETFGHHHPRLFDWLLKPLVEQWTGPGGTTEIMTFEALCGRFGPGSVEESVPSSSWSTESYDYVRGDHFPLWDSPGNIYHEALWRLVNLVRPLGALPNAEEEVLKVLSSCCWWQVSGRPSFNPRLMMHGAKKARDLIERIENDAVRRAGLEAYDRLASLPGIGG